MGNKIWICFVLLRSSLFLSASAVVRAIPSENFPSPCDLFTFASKLKKFSLYESRLGTWEVISVPFLTFYFHMYKCLALESRFYLIFNFFFFLIISEFQNWIGNYLVQEQRQHWYSGQANFTFASWTCEN